MASTAKIVDFTVSLSTLPALNEFLKDYDFVIIIMGDFNTTKKLPKNHLKLISLKNHENERVYRILRKNSYFSILCVSERC